MKSGDVSSSCSRSRLVQDSSRLASVDPHRPAVKARRLRPGLKVRLARVAVGAAAEAVRRLRPVRIALTHYHGTES